MIRPTAIGMFCHDNTFEVPRSQRIFRHGIGQCLGGVLALARLAANPRKCQVVPTITLESKGTFLESFRQSFHLYATDFHRWHVGHAFTLRQFNLLQLSIQFEHITL